MLGAALLIAAATVPLGAAAASAHDQLVGANPQPGQTLDEAPTGVDLEFSDLVQDIGGAVSVIDRQGREMTTGQLEFDRTRVHKSLRGDLPRGAYLVRWRIVSGDGHPVSGTIAFAVGQGEKPADESAFRTSEAPRATASAAPKPADEGMPDALRIPLIALGGAAVALALWWALARITRSRRAKSRSAERDDPVSRAVGKSPVEDPHGAGPTSPSGKPVDPDSDIEEL